MSEEIETIIEEEVPDEVPTMTGEVVDEPNYDNLIPKMNVNMPVAEQPPVENLIENEALLGIYGEILGMLRNEHKQVTEYIDNVAEMVINGGDSSTSSKEALVNFVKIRTDIPDKMTKIADLMTRVKLKERDTYKPYMTASQTNNVIVGGDSRRELLDAIKKAKKKDKK